MNTQRIFVALVMLSILLLATACLESPPALPTVAAVAVTIAPTATDAPTAAPSPTTAPAAPLNTAASAVTLDCQDQANLIDGPFRAENNTWGKGKLTGWTQCIGLKTAADGSLAARWTWDWPMSGSNVKAYPEVIYGQKPGGKSTTTNLPKKVSDLNEVLISYDVASTRAGSGNLAFDVWLTDTADPSTWGVPPIKTEIMIWLENFGSMAPGGSWEEVTKIDGTPYAVYTAKNWGDGWSYVAFMRTESQLGAGSLDLVSFLKYMKDKGLVTGEEYVASIEFGNEVVGGTGETSLNRLAISVR